MVLTEDLITNITVLMSTIIVLLTLHVSQILAADVCGSKVS